MYARDWRGRGCASLPRSGGEHRHRARERALTGAVAAITGQVGAGADRQDGFRSRHHWRDAASRSTTTSPASRNIAPTIAEAFYLAKSGRPGPVLSISKNVFVAKRQLARHGWPKSYQPTTVPNIARFGWPPRRSRGEGADHGGHIILSGGGGVSSSSREKTGMPVFTPARPGDVACTRVLGMIGMHGHREVNRALEATCRSIWARSTIAPPDA